MKLHCIRSIFGRICLPSIHLKKDCGDKGLTDVAFTLISRAQGKAKGARSIKVTSVDLRPLGLDSELVTK